MGKHTKKKFYDNIYSNPFQHAWANPKHGYRQINGETLQTQNIIILKREMRKRS